MAGKIECICDFLEEIDEFRSIWEFEKFQKYLDGLIKDGDLIEVEVGKPYAGFPEQWFLCNGCQQTWRLVHPDFPFKGLWEQVK